MNRLIQWLALIAIVATPAITVLVVVPSCSHVQTVATDVCKATPDLIATVDGLLGSDEYEATLSKVLTTFCALEDAVTQSAQLAGQVSANKLEGNGSSPKLAHATAWLEKHTGTQRLGLPGGGGTPHCCYHAGGFAINTPACGNGVAVTLANFQTLCNIHCLGSYFNCP